jgi:hypothetical protein
VERGLQLHFGPTDYGSAQALKPYLVLPGQEFTSYVVLNLPATAARAYAYVKLSQRPGSHHMIGMLVAGELAPGFVNPSADCGGRSLASFPSSTTPIFESPAQGVPASENAGLVHALPAGASLCLNYHRYNDTESNALSEAWINLWYPEPASAAQRAFDIVVNAGPFSPIAPHTAQRLSATSRVSGDGRILTLFGHRHAHTGRLAVFLNDVPIYASFDWSEPRWYELDSLTVNPLFDLVSQRDGTVAGALQVKTGDELTLECQVDNSDNSALPFGSDLRAQEMCVLYLSATGVSINPVSD